jgi:hypothetical protein
LKSPLTSQQVHTKGGEVVGVVVGTSICIHYWEIEPPSGLTSVGTCNHCGESREFQNYFHYYKENLSWKDISRLEKEYQDPTPGEEE